MAPASISAMTSRIESAKRGVGHRSQRPDGRSHASIKSTAHSGAPSAHAIDALIAEGLLWREEGHGGRVHFTDALMGLWTVERL